jgi:hypothetical protein
VNNLDARLIGLTLVAILASCAAPAAPPQGPGDDDLIPRGPYVAGQSYFGRNGYIEYIAGNSAVILTAPHGGSLLPAEIPDRTAAACGGTVTTTTDLNTAELVRSMQQKYFARFGTYPHVVISHLSRRKLDANRTNPEAACGDPEANTALAEWHAFIDAAKTAALASSPKAWYMDIHGHGHAIQRLELGYLLSGPQLNLPDASLDGNPAYRDTISVRSLAGTGAVPLSSLLRGATSLGTLYASNGFRAIPSSGDPRPNGDPYLSGGDNTRRHTCGAEASSFGGATAGNVCGIQLEANFTGVRDNAENRNRFAEVTALVLEQYLSAHWGLQLARP